MEKDILQQYAGIYEVSIKKLIHRLIINVEDEKIYVEDPDATDRLPKLRLYAESRNKFIIKEVTALKFEFVADEVNHSIKLITYNSRGKDSEWRKIN